MQRRLMVSDIDGTLLGPGEVLSHRTIELIHLFQNQGGVFTVATGRMQGAVLPLVKRIGLRYPVILYNGSMIMDPFTDKVIFEAKLVTESTFNSLSLARAFDVGVLMYLDGVAYTSQLTPYIEKHNQKEHVTCKLVERLEPLLDRGLTKILYMGEKAEIDLLEQKHKQVKEGFNVVRSESNYLELLPENASKGNALEKLAAYLAIPMKETVAIGDERNDLSMIRQAKVGVAVNNAVEALKEEADIIARYNYSEGVAEILERIMTGEL